jgi:hypothetical protein
VETEGFHIIDAPPNGAAFHTDYDWKDIISEILRVYPVRARRRLIAHADVARAHTSKRIREFIAENNLSRAPGPPFSPDRRPFSFFLFGGIADKLQETDFSEKHHLLAEIREILNGMSGKVLKVVFIE